MNPAFARIALLAFGVLAANTAQGADASKYVVSPEHVFETKSAAENFLRSGPAPAQKYMEVDSSVNYDGTVTHYYEVDPVGTMEFIESKYAPCDTNWQTYCNSQSEYANFVMERLRERFPNQCILGYRFEGNYDEHHWTWVVSIPPYGGDYDIVDVQHGAQLMYDSQPKIEGECTGPIIESYGPTHFKYDFYKCEEGYIGKANIESGWCEYKIKRQITGIIDRTCDTHSGNPCGILTGNKNERETDYISSTLQLTRSYNSSRRDRFHDNLGNSRKLHDAFATGWRHNYQRELVILYYLGQVGPRYYVDANGTYTPLVGRGDGPYRFIGREGHRLFKDRATGEWVLEKGASREIFTASGTLKRLEENGRVTTIATDAETGNTIITDPYGRVLELEYGGVGIRAAILPDGSRIEYEYESVTAEVVRLKRVTYPDGSSRTYHYELGMLVYHLTGISDENGNRFSTFAYNLAGQVVGSKHAGDVEQVSIHRREDGTTRVLDPLGNAAIYSYVPVHGMRKFASADAPCATCTNDAQAEERNDNGHLIRRTGFDGAVTSYVRDSLGRELSRTEAAGTPEERTITTQWHATLNLPVKITEPGRTVEFAYDDNGNRLSETVTDTATGDARSGAWAYNDFGQVLSVDGPRTDVADVTTYSYDAFGNLSTVTNALGHVTRYPRYDAHGNALEIVDPNGVVTELEYDLRQRLVRRTVAAGTVHAATTRFAYDPVGQLVKTTLPNGAWIGYEYDAAHRMTAITDSAGNRIDYVLDGMGNRIEERVSGAAGETFRETFRAYNALNRLVTESGPEGSRIDYAYDLEGKRTGITDAANGSTTSRFDALDRLFETVDALSGITAYAYDARDNLTQVIDPRGVTTDYLYNGFNELIETRSPDAGATTYQYDAAGNRTTQTDARGITASFRYDALNRLIDIDYPGTEQDIIYTYDAGTNGMGRLARIDDESGYTEYTYGARGNLTHKLNVVRGSAGEQYLPVGYGFDLADNLAAISYPSGNLVTYQRDTHGRIVAITLTKPDGTTATLASEIAHAPFGPVNALTYGNGITETRTFDREGRITGIHSAALDLGYARDATGNITGITDNLESARSQAFGYDALYRLTAATGIYGTLTYGYDAVGNRTRETRDGSEAIYSYATDSNRLLGVAGATGNTAYQYDAAGNTLSDGTQSFAYDARNRFTQADGLYTYTHNALGQRVTKPRFRTAVPGDASGDGVINEQDLHALRDVIKGNAPATDGADCNEDGNVDNKDVSCIANQIGNGKNKGRMQEGSAAAIASSLGGEVEVVGEILFVYDEAGHLIGEYDELGNRIREYVWLGDRPVVMLSGGGTSTVVHYIHVNNIDAPQVVTDQNGQVVWRVDYKPFGEVVETVSTIEMPLRYPGQYHDIETGLNYNYFRSYDPATGRYSSADPLGLRGGLNVYQYGYADPIALFDPFGLEVTGRWIRKPFAMVTDARVPLGRGNARRPDDWWQIWKHLGTYTAMEHRVEVQGGFSWKVECRESDCGGDTWEIDGATIEWFDVWVPVATPAIPHPGGYYAFLGRTTYNLLIAPAMSKAMDIATGAAMAFELSNHPDKICRAYPR